MKKFEDLLSTASTKMYFRVTIPEDMGQVTLDSEMLRLLIALNEKKNLAEIAAECGRSTSEMRESLGRLIEHGIVEPLFATGKTRKLYLDQDFMDSLAASMTRAVGPMGRMLVSETLEKLGTSENKIPVALAAELINTLAHQVPDTRRRRKFQKEMVEVLRKCNL